MRKPTIYALWVVAVAVILIAAPAPSTPASTADAGRVFQLINQSRDGAGLPAVRSDATLNSIAQGHAQRMASDGTVYHNPSYPGSAGSWDAWGENVGRGPDPDSVHRAFMGSAVHRANILNPRFNLVGVGVARWEGGLMIVQDFLSRPGLPAAPKPVAAKPRPPAHPAPPPPPPVVEPDEPLGCHWEGTALN